MQVTYCSERDQFQGKNILKIQTEWQWDGVFESWSLVLCWIKKLSVISFNLVLRYPFRNSTQFQMSSQSLENESSSQSSDSEAEHLGPAQVTSKAKRAKQNRARAWTFKNTIETDLLSADTAEGVPTDEKTKLLAEHVRNRLGHNQPHAVHSVTAFSNLKNVFTRLQHQSATVSIPVVCFVQSNPCTVHMMQQWVPDAAWAPVPGGVASDPEFLRHCDLAASPNEPWFKLTIFGELGLNNQARASARRERKVPRPLGPTHAFKASWVNG